MRIVVADDAATCCFAAGAYDAEVMIELGRTAFVTLSWVEDHGGVLRLPELWCLDWRRGRALG